jgi:adenylate cyclase
MRPRLASIGVVIALTLATFTVSRRDWYGTARELVFDAMLLLKPAPPTAWSPVVVDIDRDSLNAAGPWPWGRDQIGALLKVIAAAEPKAIAVDILLEGQDERSPAAMARKLAAVTGDRHIAELAGKLLDGDQELIEAVRADKTVLGAVLDPARPFPGRAVAPVLVRGKFDPTEYWGAGGLTAPQEGLISAAKGLGLLAIPGDADGSVRRVPLIAAAGNFIVPGLALELQRVAHGATAIILSQDPPSLAIGALKLRIQSDGMLRLAPPHPRDWPRRTLSAQQLLAHPSELASRLKDRAVLVGSSAPEAGGLRPAANDVLAPTVQLQADAFAQLSTGAVPLRPQGIEALEALLAVFGGIFGAFTGNRLAPRSGSALMLVLSGLFVAASIYACINLYLLIDPLLPSSMALICFTIAALAKAAIIARREAAIRRRFEQHLAPAVARRIIAEPELLRVAGEVREITALFTDIEGFTAMTARAAPQKLIAALDAYFDGISSIVIEHGGLIDKIAGDAVHAFFNVPLDLDDHPRRALECAIAIERFALLFRKKPLAVELQFGGTRIGLETGAAIVGDVGGSRKLDYTAHGNVVNAAARFEAANKTLGTGICIGPGAAAYIGHDILRPLGKIMISGRAEAQEVYSLWPAAYTAADRVAFKSALTLVEADPGAAIASLRALATRRQDDTALVKLCERLAAA